MINTHSAARLARRSLALLAALTALSFAQAQSVPLAAAGAFPQTGAVRWLEPYVTTATRTPAAPQTIGSDAAAISAADLATSQIDTVAGALGSVAGAPMFASGAPGSATSLFLRGANSNQTLFLVDGIPLNGPNTDYQVFLGGATLGAGDRLEIVRGPQSTLYGADAIGGVISLEAERGHGPATSQLSVEGGSYGTVDGSVASQGEQGASAWNFSAQGGHTDNARPNNAFDSANVVLRLDRTLNEQVAVGGTLRWFHSRLGSPGDRFTNDPNDRETEDDLLATVFTDLKFGPDWTAHAVLGGEDRRYVDDTPAPNPPYGSAPARNIVVNRRAVLDAQTSYTGLRRNRITVGITGQENETRNNGFGRIDRHQTQFAVFAQDEFRPADNLYLTAGLRNDDFDTFGHATTGRATAAWLVVPRRLKLRASYGTGFRAPSFLDLYGQDSYYVGNPNLAPERSRGVDAGADYYLPDARGTLSATWFETDFRNLIDYNFNVFPSTTVNVGRARTQGVELAARTVLPGEVAATLSYTYLDARSLLPAGHARLLRRPLNELSVDLHRTFGAGVTAGAGVQYVGRRADVDAQTYATITDGGFSVVRVYASWQATRQLAVKARIENALNRHDEPVNGYPALGAAAYAGVAWSF